MKSVIFLAVVVLSLIVQVHGSCSVSEVLKCVPKTYNCDNLLKAINCYEHCGINMPDDVRKAVHDAGCGASALNNLGIPIMLLVAVVAFYNK